MTSRRLGLVECAVELGHRHPECFRDALDLLCSWLEVSEFDLAESRDLDVRVVGKLLLEDSAQLAPVPSTLTGSQAHSCILHRAQGSVNLVAL